MSIRKTNYRSPEVQGTWVDKVDHEKDIGVTIHENLTFKLHTANKIKKANSMFALLRRIFEFLDADIFVPLYKALVRVYLEYAGLKCVGPLQEKAY